MQPRRVLRLAKRQRVELPIGMGRGARRLHAVVKAGDLPALDAVAEAAAVSRAEIIRRLLAVALEDGGKPAIRLLGAKARPKRAYTPRKTPEQQEAARRAQEAAQATADAERLASLPDWLRAALAAGQHPLRAVRLHLGLRQRDVEEAAGVSQNKVGELERGCRPLTPRMRGRLAVAMGVEPEWLAAC